MDFAIVAILAATPLIGFVAAPTVNRRDALHRTATVLAAGVLLGLLVSHLLPEVLREAGRWAPALMLSGFVAMMLVQQRVLRTDPCCSHEHVPHADVPALAALGLCATNDGVLLALDATHHEGVTSPLLWGLALHKIVAAFAFWTLLTSLQPAPSRLRRFIYAGIFVSISPVAYCAATALSGMAGLIAGAGALASGALLYVLVAGMLPQVEHHARQTFTPTFLAFVLGLGSTAAIEIAFPHHHGEHDHGHAAPVENEAPDDGERTSRGVRAAVHEDRGHPTGHSGH